MVSPLSPLQIGRQEKPDLVGSYLGGRQAFQAGQLTDQAIQQNKQQMSRADLEYNLQRIQVANRIFKKAKEYPVAERANFMASLNDSMLQSVGADKKTLGQTRLDDTGLDAAIAQTGSVLDQNSEFKQNRVQSTTKFKNGTIQQVLANGGTRVLDPSGREITGDEARRILEEANQYEIDNAVKQSGESAAAKTTADINSRIAGGGRAEEIESLGKARAELATRPEITKATDTAANEADATAKAKAVAQKNANALATYEAGIKSVSESLGNTSTGPFVGKAPAMTANQQIADGSLAAMAPVLKGLFREAGEGTFTKEDQQILMDMLPTRKDLPAARTAKLKNVGTLIKTKLTTQPVGDVKEAGSAPKKLTYDPATGTFK